VKTEGRAPSGSKYFHWHLYFPGGLEKVPGKFNFLAFANSLGGTLIIGVTDAGEVKGLSDEDLRRLNQAISNVSSEHVKPAIFPNTEIMVIEDRKVLLVHIPYGVNKPYCTNKGIYYTKSGADKRNVSQDELRRLFQESGKLYAEEMVFKNASHQDIDLELFKEFHEKKYGIPFTGDEKSLPQVLGNLNLASDGFLNLAGLLLFGKNPMKYIPICQAIAVSFVGNEMGGDEYRDSENIEGNLKKLYTNGLAFLKRNQTLASFAFDLIPYRGIGSGILRALRHYPHIEFVDDVEIEQFKATIKRPSQ
jgi:ATP-dependent DNA helicase RecG